MNRLRSIIALQVYVCMWGVWNAIQDKKRERERESFDLSECIWCCRKETVVMAVEKKKENTISKACRQEVSVFHSSSHIPPVYSLLSVRFASTSVFISSSCVVHLFNILVARAILCSLSLSLFLFLSLCAIYKKLQSLNCALNTSHTCVWSWRELTTDITNYTLYFKERSKMSSSIF